MRKMVELAKKGHGEEQTPDSRGIYSDTGAGYQMLVVEAANLPDVAATEGAQTVAQTVAEPMESGRIPSWLARTWRHAGRKGEFDVDLTQWLEEYPDLVKLIEACDGSTIDAWPRADLPQTYTIRLKPRTLELLQAQLQQKPGPKTCNRQITVDGKHVDIRNKRGLMMLNSPIENLLALAEVSIEELAREIDPKVRRAHVMYLRDLIGFRGHELPERRRDTILEALSPCTTQGIEVGKG
jgi:hypothetical protein